MVDLRTTAARSALPLALICVLGACDSTSESNAVPRMKFRRVVSEVLLSDAEWVEVTRRDDSKPGVAVITPSKDFRVDGADLPSLVLSPPAEIEFSTEGWPTPALLQLKMGLDRTVIEEYGDQLKGHRVEFVVSFDGLEVERHSIAVEQVGRLPGSEWSSADCGAIASGGSVRLRTALLDADGAEIDFDAPLTVGFGAIELVEERLPPRQPSSRDEPNIVLLVMDTQRADRLSAYGYERPTSPNLDRLAERGTLFEDAYATSNWTWPSTASILTGLHPGAHGLEDENSAFLPQGLTTLAEVLQDQGYSTAGWSTNYLLASNRNFDQGFELYRHAKGHSQSSGQVMPEVLAWMESMQEHKFFLYLQLIDPHAPQSPMPEARALLAADVPPDFSPTAINDYKNRLYGVDCRDELGTLDTDACVSPEHQSYISDLYDACVWSGDYWLGRILDQLDASQLTGRTVVVFTSDHGEELFEHGLLTHGHSLHPELVQIPLVLAGPGIESGQRVATSVSNRQLAPTLAELAGATFPDLPDPIDLLNLEQGTRSDVYFSTATGWWRGHRRTPILGVRTPQRVLHWAPRGGDWGKASEANGQRQLYDKLLDFGEFSDLAGTDSTAADELQGRVRAFFREVENQRTTPAVPAGEATLQRLRDVGYLGED